MKIKTIRSKEDVEMKKNLFEHLEKYEQFSFDMTTGIIYAAIQNGKLIYQGEIE